MLRVLSLLAFIVVLFWCYTSLPLEVAVHYDQKNRADLFITKSQLFYGLAAFIVLFNTVFSLLANLIPSLPASRLSLLNQQYWQENKEYLQNIVVNWLHSLVVAVNIFLISCLAVILVLNTSDNAKVSSYGWLAIVGGVILLGWLAFLPLRQMVKTATLEEA